MISDICSKYEIESVVMLTLPLIFSFLYNSEIKSWFINLLLKCLFFSHGSGLIIKISSIDLFSKLFKRYRQLRPQSDILYIFSSLILFRTFPKPLIKTSHPI